MVLSGKRWITHDRDGNSIYLTEERWAHITDAGNHPELGDHEQLCGKGLFQTCSTQEPTMTPANILPSAVSDTIRYDYDQDVDILYVSFAPGEQATAAVELNDTMLLRFNLEERCAVGLTLMDFSVLAQPAALGPRHFPLSGLQELEPAWQEVVIALITSPPVNRILTAATFSSSVNDLIPIVSVENPLAVAN